MRSLIFWASLLAGILSTAPATAEQYLRDVWASAHTPAAMAKAKDDQCLACHKNILSDQPLTTSPSGTSAATQVAWYQTLTTYTGEQDSFHRRHLTTPFAKSVMKLQCNTCHLGHDPREEAAVPSSDKGPPLATLRKQVNPETSCLKCHGTFPAAIMGLEGDWHELRGDLETEDQPNGCLSCHAEQFRTVRHNVTYLRGADIEKLARQDPDVCFGCHGGRAWYRISFPYPRHAWPGMPAEIPDWAKDRPTESEARFLETLPKPAAKPAAKKK